MTGIWYVVGFAFAGVSFVFLTIGAAWLAHNGMTDRLTRVDPVLLTQLIANLLDMTRIESGGLVTVRFAKDASERKLMLEYAPLEKIL